MADVDGSLAGQNSASVGPPPLTGAYASLISNDVADHELSL